MAAGSVKIAFEQPASFMFSEHNEEEAKRIIAKYPAGRQQAAVIPLLMMAQRQHDNWLPQAAIEYVAALLDMPKIRVMEVASFYTMYNLKPMGRYHIQCCTTTPCWLRGSDEVMRACQETLGIRNGETSADGMFTLNEVECLGACVNAPMMEVTSSQMDVYYEDLSYDSTKRIIQSLKRGETPKAGSQSGRHSSEPLSGATTLLEKHG